jgi:hypothetical protein
VTNCALQADPTSGSGVGSAGLAGVNINVLQCEENASFTDSTEDIVGQQMVLNVQFKAVKVYIAPPNGELSRFNCERTVQR